MPRLHGKCESYDFDEVNKFLVYNIAEGKDDWGEVSWFDAAMTKVAEEVAAGGACTVLRLFHEMNKSWFWWGSSAYGGPEAYRLLFRRAVSIIRARTHLALFAWSPNHPFDAAAEVYYPGDDVVDIIGIDIYDVGEDGYPSFAGLADHRQSLAGTLAAMKHFAAHHCKIAAITETGNRKGGATRVGWWTCVRDTILACEDGAVGLAWVLAYGNAPWVKDQIKEGESMDSRLIVPYSGSARELRDDFRIFATHPAVRLLGTHRL
jgi:hypothetical protein